MQISMIGTLPPIKGVSDYCLELTKELTKDNKVEFISFKKIYPEFLYPGGTTDKEFKYEKNKNLNVYNVLTWYNPCSWLKAGLSVNSDVVHIQWWTTYLFPMFFTICSILRMRKKKIIFTVHNVVGHESGLLDKWLSRIMFKFPDTIIVHTNNNRKQLKEYFNVEAVVIPHGIYNFYKNSKITKREARRRLGLKKKVILYFGNIREYKGVDLLIGALHYLKNDYSLVIAGKCWGDWYKYQRLINSYGVWDNVRSFLDYIPYSEVEKFFKAADIVVLPYKHFESQSGPGNIALAFGKPLIVTDVGGLPSLVKSKKYVVRPNEIEIADAIRKADLNKMSRDSKELAKKYSWENIVVKLMRVYKWYA